MPRRWPFSSRPSVARTTWRASRRPSLAWSARWAASGPSSSPSAPPLRGSHLLAKPSASTSGGTSMRFRHLALALALIGLVAGGLAPTDPARAQDKTIKIGLLFDFTGPFSAAGALMNYRGAKLA